MRRMIRAFSTALRQWLEIIASRRSRIVADPQRVERDLARLVLSIVELLRKLLERQAVRRVESGVLREDEIERLGETLLKLESRMSELKAAFGLGDQELTLDLGPLRNLISECE